MTSIRATQNILRPLQSLLLLLISGPSLQNQSLASGVSSKTLNHQIIAHQIPTMVRNSHGWSHRINRATRLLTLKVEKPPSHAILIECSLDHQMNLAR